jgi:hypothetical protein
MLAWRGVTRSVTDRSSLTSTLLSDGASIRWSTAEDLDPLEEGRRAGAAGLVVAAIARDREDDVDLVARHHEAGDARGDVGRLDRHGSHPAGHQRRQALARPLGGELGVEHRLPLDQGDRHGAIDRVLDLGDRALGDHLLG